MYHYRKKHQRYMANAKGRGCPFCDPQEREHPVKEMEHTLVIPNKYFYDAWETHSVEDHLLIVPKRHVAGLNELTHDERSEVMELIAEYEAQGYNVYARAPGNVRKSVVHQHTHLIKITGERARLYIATKRPYWVFKI